MTVTTEVPAGPTCVIHPSSAGSPHYASMTKQLKCHWENKFPAEISGTELPGGAPREFHCCQAMQARDQIIRAAGQLLW